MINVNILEAAYAAGAFPMAYSEDPEGPLDWFKPRRRSVFFPDQFHIPRRLARFLRQRPFEIRWNTGFGEIIRACADRPEGSWINQEIIDSYTEWHRQGGVFCLSVHQDGKLVGGIYGPQMGGAFMAESMFSRMPNASSVALVVLVAGLHKAGVEMIDTQYTNPHLTKFNPVMVTGKTYDARLQELLQKNVELKADYFCFDVATEFVQSLTHTS